MMPNPVHVLIADTTEHLRWQLLKTTQPADFTLCPSWSATVAEVNSFCREMQPDVLLLSQDFLPSSPAEALTKLTQLVSSDRLLLMVNNDDEIQLQPYLGRGLTGCVHRNDSIKIIINAIQAVNQGSFYFSERIRKKLDIKISATCGSQRLPPIAEIFLPREQKILMQLCQGKKNREIAESLRLSKKTIDNKLTLIYRKINVKSRAQAICWANQNELFPNQ